LRNIVIIGGGLAGLISAIQLAKAGLPCVLIEKKSYPLHRVCGEYISNEVLPFLKENGLYPEEFSPPQINRFQLSSVTGRETRMPLDLGGFGISRFTWDNYLYKKALALGVEFLLDTEVQQVQFINEHFLVTTPEKKMEADLVIGAFGKRSKLDVSLNRKFIRKRSPYAGIKYHLRTEHPTDLISLHNFNGGYCGMSNIEDGKTNLCYLTHRDNLRRYGDIATMEVEVLYKNPLLKHVFSNAEFIFKKPEVINEISFERKAAVENHVLMAGDAAGMITPLCGNGMAMAIHAAKILSELAIDFCHGKIARLEMEKRYTSQWQKLFAQRLWNGRQVQRLFGNAFVSNIAVNLALYNKPIANMIMRNTHGEVF
jgi:flavin-dependent dehydrogenase